MYEYRCEACGTRFERLQWHSSDSGARCDCGCEQVERIPYSRVSVGGSHAEKTASCAEGACMPAGCCGGGACQMN